MTELGAALLGLVIVPLLMTELFECASWMSDRILFIASRRLPANRRADELAHWQGEIDAMPGKMIKVFAAISTLWKSGAIGRELNQSIAARPDPSRRAELFSPRSTYFGHSFLVLDNSNFRDLGTLEEDGCVYTDALGPGEPGGQVCVRIRLRPKEIVTYVEAMVAYDQFHMFWATYKDPEIALSLISDTEISERVRSYNRWLTDTDGDSISLYCPAAFLGGDLEDLFCGHTPDRYEEVPTPSKNWFSDWDLP